MDPTLLHPVETVVMEAGTHSPWVSRFLQELGLRSALDRIRRDEKHLKLQNGDDPQLDLAGSKHPDGERSSPPLSNEPEYSF